MTRLGVLAILFLLPPTRVCASPLSIQSPVSVGWRPAGTEIVELRTADSRHYANGDGTVTSVIDASASLQAVYTGYSELGYVYGSLNDSNRGVGGVFYCGYYDLVGLVTVLERGWVEWNISSIPDTATITSVRCSTYCYSTTGTVTGLTLRHMANRPSTTPGVSLLYNDAGDGSIYSSRANPTTGWLNDSLSSQARIDLTNRLAQDWFAIGYSATGSGTQWEIAFNGTGTTTGPPRLVVVWGSSATADVGVSRIVAPTGIIDSTASVAPACSVRNYGTVAASNFLVRCRIGSFYSDTARVTSLAPGAATLVTFPARSAWPRGRFAVVCSTALTADTLPGNDRRIDSVTVRVLDALPLAIVAPTGVVDSGTTIVPQVTVRNASSIAAVIPVWLRIGNWQDSTQISLPAESSATVTFNQWTAAARGEYGIACTTRLAGDMIPANDTLSGSVAVAVTDVAVRAIIAPAGTTGPGPITPRATVRNLGTTRTAARINFAINSSPPYTALLDLPAGLPDVDTTLEFPVWNATPGSYSARCSVAVAGDLVPANDTLSRAFTVADSTLPPGWTEITQVPLLPSGRAVKDGGAIAWDAGTGLLYVLKGNKTGDFYSFDGTTWTTLTAIPVGTEAKPPAKGAGICTDGNGVVYAVKGNNTQGFWQYSGGTWTQLADIPLGVSNKKVKGGTDLVYVDAGDSQYVYLLKGYKTEFYRYNVTSGVWQPLADAPAGQKPKWDKGSWLALDLAGNRIFAHKAKYHELYAYDLATGNWGEQLAGMPLLNSQTGKSKKSKDGGSAAFLADGMLYALKGGNTCDFYGYEPGSNQWAEKETMPQVGSSQKKKRVKGGGDITSDGSFIYALKGNKTVELWRYTPGTVMVAAPVRSGVMAGTTVPPVGMTLGPNPLTGNTALLRWSLPAAAPATVQVYDITGRTVLVRSLAAGRSGATSLDLRGLAAGVYLVRLTAGDYTAAQKLVIE